MILVTNQNGGRGRRSFFRKSLVDRHVVGHPDMHLKVKSLNCNSNMVSSCQGKAGSQGRLKSLEKVRELKKKKKYILAKGKGHLFYWKRPFFLTEKSIFSNGNVFFF